MEELGTKGELSETIGDNSVDNFMQELERAACIEVGRFVGSLLNSHIQRFLHCYDMPQHEEFRSVFKQVLNRYQIMDGDEQGDLFRKIENMFKDIFVNKYSDLGPEVAELIAKRYAVQMIDVLKQNAIRANVDDHVDKSEVYY